VDAWNQVEGQPPSSPSSVTGAQGRNASVQLGDLSHLPQTTTDSDPTHLVDQDGGVMTPPDRMSPNAGDSNSLSSATGFMSGPTPQQLAAALTGQAPVAPSMMAQLNPPPGGFQSPPQAPQTPQIAQGPPQSPQAAGGAGSSTVSPQPASNAQRAFSYFTSKGYTPQAAAGIVGNLQAESGLNPAAYNQAERAGGIAQWSGARLNGLKAFARANGTTPDDFQTQLDYLHQELQGPEGKANAALMQAQDPQSAAAAAAGFERPAGWTPNGQPQAISGWNTRASAAQAAMTAYGGQQPGNGPGAYQVAQNGPLTVGPPSGGPGAQPAPAATPAPSSGRPQIQYGPAATPQEAQIINGLLASGVPALREKGEAMMEAITQRRATPIEMESRWDPNTGTNVWVPKQPGFGQEVAMGPPPGWRPPLPSGMQYSANGVAQPIPGTATRPLTDPAERAAVGIAPNDRNTYAVSADGKVTKVADAPFSAPVYSSSTVSQTGPNNELHTQSIPGSWSPAQILEARNNMAGSKPVVDAREAFANFDALQKLAMQPGGTKAYAFRDALARIFNPGGIARTNQIELLMNSAGVPDSVKQYFGNLTGDGNLDPRIAQQGLDAAYAFAKSRADQVAAMNQSSAGLAKRHQIDPEDLAVDIPQVSPMSLPGQRSVYAAPAPPSPQAAAASLANARTAIAQGKDRNAVIQRLRAAGIDPGQL
jgi:hypothetical protein